MRWHVVQHLLLELLELLLAELLQLMYLLLRLLLLTMLRGGSSHHLLLDFLQRPHTLVQVRAELETGGLVGDRSVLAGERGVSGALRCKLID